MYLVEHCREMADVTDCRNVFEETVLESSESECGQMSQSAEAKEKGLIGESPSQKKKL